jgi:hypothetical protein
MRPFRKVAGFGSGKRRFGVADYAPDRGKSLPQTAL